MNEIRAINTRLDVKNSFDELKENFFLSRTNQTNNIIKPMNQDNILQFHNFRNLEKDTKLSADDMDVKYTEFKDNEIFKNTIYSQNTNNIPKINDNVKKENTNNISQINDNVKKENNNIPKINENVKKENTNNIPKINENVRKENTNNIPKINENVKKENNNIPKNNENVRKENTNNISQINENVKKENNNIKLNIKNFNQSPVIENSYNKNTTNLITNNVNLDNKNPKDTQSRLINIIFNTLNKRNICVNRENIGRYLVRYNVYQNKIDRKVLSQIINEIKTLYQPKFIKKKNIDLKDKSIEKTFLLSIDSVDRDITKYPNPNEFRIDLNFIDNGNSKEYIKNSFENIISIQLVSAIFPKEIEGGMLLEDYPYIIIEIDELGSNYQTTNVNNSNIFAQLTFDLDCGKYKKFISRTDMEYKKNFFPKITLNSFSIRIKTPDRVLYNFGEPMKIDENNLEDNLEYNPNINENNLEYNPNINENNLEYNPNINEDNLEYNPNINEDNQNIKIKDTYPLINFTFKITQLKQPYNINY